MTKYVLGRLLFIIPIIIGVTFITFTILSFTPGDPGTLILGPTAPKEAIEELNRELGFDQPFFIRFFNYAKNAFTKFDFGNSYRNGKPVVNEILLRFPTTVILSVMAIIAAALIGIPIGILSAVKQYSVADTISTFSALFFAAIPAFWFGMMSILVFSLYLRLLPSSGVETWKSFILPTITLALPPGAMLLRITRTTMLETIRQDYIRTARAKGAPENRIIFKHALKNAMLPVITSLGMMFALLLGGTVIIEAVFGLPGIGTLILSGIRTKDIPLVMASTIFLATIFCIIIMIIDILYGFIDPRIKAKFSK